ncbi:hypothetical protein CY35_12G079000 [Sphagnum magellanicum]|nr:hypothetical protein CY35_12G079000 [Sphagnum magellanicum]
MAVLRMSMVVSKARCGCLLGRSQSGLVKSSNAYSRVAMVGVPVGRSRLKIAAPLPSFGSGRRSVKNLSTTTTTTTTTVPYEQRSCVRLRNDSLSSTPFERTTPPPPVVEEGPKLYVGNLPWTCDSQQLAEIFQDCGAVELVEVIYDRETSRSRGFGFVTMGITSAEASAAKQTLDGYFRLNIMITCTASLEEAWSSEVQTKGDHARHNYSWPWFLFVASFIFPLTYLEGKLICLGRSLTVSFPQSNRADRSHPLPQREFGSNGGGGSGSYDSENKLFVGNLSWGVDDASLQTTFSDYGKVVDASVVYDRETARSCGFGFVTLSTAAEVNDGIQNLDGAVRFDGRQLPINLAGDKPP